MIADLKPYPAMKDSGVPWLGEVPEHWEVRRNGRLFAQRNETGFADLPILEVSLKTGVRVREFANSNRKQVMADRDKYKRAAKGDIAYNMMRMWQGAVGVVPVDGLVSPAYVVARPYPQTVTGYYGYLFHVGTYMNEVNNYSRGIVSDRNRLYWDEFKQMPSLFPSPAEQQAIVRFLDHVDQRIRRYIRAKQKLIKLLEEQKQAIIHRAVTRGLPADAAAKAGLDPNVRLKPSGVEWLGGVPEHWDVVPLRWYISIGSGDFLETERVCSEATQDRPYPVIGGNGVMGYAATFNSYDTTIVIGRVGALCGNVHLVKTSAWITDNALRVSHIKGFNPEYLATQMRAMNLNRLANANAQPLVTGRMIKSQHVVKPSIEEQQTLITCLRTLLAPIEVAITKTQPEISILREYRTRLIADVVTGKLDVREAAARLPDETEELEALNEADALDSDENAGEAGLDTAPEEAEA